MNHVDRRSFLRSSAKYAGGALVAPALGGLAACNDALAPRAPGVAPGLARAGKGQGGYGPLVAAGPELELPEGFQYRVFGRTGSLMSDGVPTPGSHDGMAAYPDASGGVRLVRNHEVRSSGGAFGDPSRAYDPRSGGGTTTLVVDRDRNLVRSFASLNGTSTNCAGGPTPWGSWLTCEETTVGPAQGYLRPHGYVFEVPASAEACLQAPEPFRAMGRFVHEAVAVDPHTGIVYLTEDQRIRAATPSYPFVLGSGFYRFVPAREEDLRSGRLQMLALRGQGRGSYNTAVGQTVGTPLPVVWVDIGQPDPVNADVDPFAVAKQGIEKGAAVFARLEGCWWSDDRSIYFVATSGGDAGLGQVWQYRPLGASGGQLTLIFESPSADVLDGPDNVVVTPRGGLLLCEDGDDAQFVRGLTPRGEIFDFAKNRLNDSEFAGATFSPDGETLFVNIQSPGMTIAIWGPWEEGVL